MSVHAQRLQAAWLGTLLFVCSEAMLFGGLFASYFTLAAASEVWPPEGTHDVELALPGALTALLVTSSITQHAAAAHARAARAQRARRLMLGTAVLGLAFAAGQAYEYASAPFALGDSTFTTLFFTITGFHGLHVLGGVGGVLAARARAEDPGIVEAATTYWHFVDAVWIVVFTVLYLLR